METHSQQKKGSLNIIHHETGDIVEATVGKVMAGVFQHPGFASYKSWLKDIPPERVNEIYEKFKDVEWNGDIEVNLNHSPVFRQLKRLFESDRKNSLFTRVALGVPATLLYGAMGRIGQWSYYNPYAESLQLYNENKYADFARMGVAELIDRQKNPIMREVMSLANSIPIYTNTLLFIKANQELKKKLTKEEKAEAAPHLDASSIGEGVVDAVALVGLASGFLNGDGGAFDPKEAVAGIVDPKGIAIGAGIAGTVYGFSKYLNRLEDVELIEPSVYFDSGIKIDDYLDEKKRKKKQEEDLPVGLKLNALAG